MGGEWFVGGFEAKGLAYALVFAALAAVFNDRWEYGLDPARRSERAARPWSEVGRPSRWLSVGWTLRTDRPPLVSMLPGLAVAALLALTGLIPALRLTTGADPAVIAKANHIYVYERFGHHLSFFHFRGAMRLRFAALVFVWGLLAAVEAARCAMPSPAAARQYFAGASSGRHRDRRYRVLISRAGLHACCAFTGFGWPTCFSRWASRSRQRR